MFYLSFFMQVFYSNRKSAKKLEREQRTKVFDYQSKFLPALKESRNGDREYPSYEVTLYLGRADSSLVSIVITHAMAKMSLHNASTAGENFWSEPNENDRFATNLEEDCFYQNIACTVLVATLNVYKLCLSLSKWSVFYNRIRIKNPGKAIKRFSVFAVERSNRNLPAIYKTKRYENIHF